MIMAATTITTAELADALGTTPRELRKFLRADAKATGSETPGKGARYALPGDKRSITAMQKKFAKWEEAQESARAARNAAVEDESVDEVDEDEVLEEE